MALFGLKGLPLDIDVDIRPAIRQIRKEFRDLSESEVNKGLARSLNELIGKAKVQASRKVREKYKVKSAYIKGQMKPIKARRTNLTAMLTVSIKPMPVYAFGAKQTEKGVTVNIMGKRKLIKSAFIATMKSGHTGVYGRGIQTSNEFLFRTKRVKYKGGWDKDLPIDEMVTASPYQMVLQKNVAKALQHSLSKEFMNVFTKQLLRVRAGY